MRFLISGLILLLTTSCLFSQNNINGVVDSSALKIKLQEYKFKLKEAGFYEKQAQNELTKVKQYKKEAHDFLDSATVTERRAQYDLRNSKAYMSQFNILYNSSAKCAKLADSSVTIALAYQDTANTLNKEAETYYFKITDEYQQQVIAQNKIQTEVAVRHDTAVSAIYVVQLGAGNMDWDYFQKVKDIQIVTSSDGIKRYIVGRFKTKEEAFAYRQKMVDIGFKDAFIRTTDSLKY